MECICITNARHKVIIFCKSCPLNWQLKTITTSKEIKQDHHDYTSLKGASEWKSIVEISRSV